MREATLPALLESADLLPAMDGGGRTTQICSALWMGGGALAGLCRSAPLNGWVAGRLLDSADLLPAMDWWRRGEPLSRLLIVCRTCSVVVLWFIAGIPQAGRARNSGPLTVLLPTLTIHPRKG